MNYCIAGGHRIAFRRQGAGEAVLFVHGITTYSFIWRNLIPELSTGYDVVAPDLLGCGDSDKPLDVSYSLKNHAEILAGFVRDLGLEPIHYVGHDLGGGIGQILAVRHPELLRSLTMINTVGYDFWPVQPISALRTPVLRHMLMSSLDLGSFRVLVRRGMHHKDRVTSELMKLFHHPLETSAGRKAFLHFARCLDNNDLMEIAEDLKTLSLPVLIVRGEEDIYLSEAIAERLHHEISGSRFVGISTGGHFIQEDEPKMLADAIIDFLATERHGSR